MAVPDGPVGEGHCISLRSGRLRRAEIVVYLRPKIGFCNCTTGVSDDAELERVADVSLFDQRYTPLADGHAIKVGTMQGRSRPYRGETRDRGSPGTGARLQRALRRGGGDRDCVERRTGRWVREAR